MIRLLAALTFTSTLTLTWTATAMADDLFWSFPRDDVSAIEIDDLDIRSTGYEDQPAFLKALGKCDMRKGQKLLRDRERGIGIPLREIRIRKGVFESRCVMPLATWRTRLGKRFVERVEDELDAHMAFLTPRKLPPPKKDPTDGGTP